jgi:sterol desaturase/sphingolipid hydroxylase (fatty acid hydroxylase superfamily)
MVVTMWSLLSGFQSVVSYLFRPFTVPQLVGYGSMFGIVVGIALWRSRNARGYFGKSFRTDLAYAAWFPVYTTLIGIPLSLNLAAIVSEYVPFLRLGLLSRVPSWLNLILWVAVSDLTLYWLHRSMHRWSWLWTLHKTHHSQQSLNPLTTWRTNVFEFVYLNLGNFVVALLLGNFAGYHPIVVGLLAASQFAQHSDMNWSYGPLGRFIVSPRFHARHHSAESEDLNVNFGSLLVVWDFVFGTARDVSGRAPSYGLLGSHNDFPESFWRQQLYPITIVWRRLFRRVA